MAVQFGDSHAHSDNRDSTCIRFTKLSPLLSIILNVNRKIA